MVTSHFDVQVLQTHNAADTIAALQEHNVALVTINRKLNSDYSDGLEVLKAIKANESVRSVPVMLVTNYEEHQVAAIAAGGVQGFGKLSLQQPETIELLQQYLG